MTSMSSSEFGQTDAWEPCEETVKGIERLAHFFIGTRGRTS